MKTRGIRDVVSRTRVGAQVACLLSCGHTVLRINRESTRPTAICRECRVANPTPVERMKKMREVRSSLEKGEEKR